MRSMAQILGAVIDGEINTKLKAEAMLDHEAPQYAAALQLTQEDAYRQLKEQIILAATRYLPQTEAEKIKQLFQTKENY